MRLLLLLGMALGPYADPDCLDPSLKSEVWTARKPGIREGRSWLPTSLGKETEHTRGAKSDTGDAAGPCSPPIKYPERVLCFQRLLFCPPPRWGGMVLETLLLTTQNPFSNHSHKCRFSNQLHFFLKLVLIRVVLPGRYRYR